MSDCYRFFQWSSVFFSCVEVRVVFLPWHMSDIVIGAICWGNVDIYPFIVRFTFMWNGKIVRNCQKLELVSWHQRTLGNIPENFCSNGGGGNETSTWWTRKRERMQSDFCFVLPPPPINRCPFDEIGSPVLARPAWDPLVCMIWTWNQKEGIIRSLNPLKTAAFSPRLISLSRVTFPSPLALIFLPPETPLIIPGKKCENKDVTGWEIAANNVWSLWLDSPLGMLRLSDACSPLYSTG